MTSRELYIEKIEKLIKNRKDYDTIYDIEDILRNHNASEDDSDPNEGFFVSMDLNDLKSAYGEISKLLGKDKNSPKKMYESLVSKSNLNDYDQGWVDGYKAAKGIK